MEINFNNVGSLGANSPVGANSEPKKILSSHGKIFGFEQTKTEIVINKDGSKTEKTFSKNGVLLSETVYKQDANGKDIIYSHSTFDQRVDKNGDLIKTVRMYIDEDGDGFDDYFVEIKYQNGELVSHKKEKQENINDVKNRPHMEYEIHNRRMDNLRAGVMML